MTGNGVPPGIKVLGLDRCACVDRTVAFRVFILIFTFLCYTSYHLSRKPISVVKSVLFRKNCSVPLDPDDPVVPGLGDSTACDWAPFDHSNHEELLGGLDLSYLFAYAVGMFISGHVAERMNLRHFLSIGMLLSGTLTAAFGFGYFFNIHFYAFYIIVQVACGLVQATGWPSVVACVGNWYGKGKRGLIMGVWNSHTSVGNILGSLIAGFFVNHAWGWSFVVPGIIIGAMGVLVFFFLVPHPDDVDCKRPQQHDPQETVASNGEASLQSPNSYGASSASIDNPAFSEMHSDSTVTLTMIKPQVTPETDSETKEPKVVYIVGSESSNSLASAANCVVTIPVGTQLENGKTADHVAMTPGGDDHGDSKSAVVIDVNSLSNGVTSVGASTGNPQMIYRNKDFASANSVTPLLKKNEEQAISFFRALTIPGVIEFSSCLFFAKLVSYTFLFWLPKYIFSDAKYELDPEFAADLSTLFDVGGIVGGITAGLISDYTGARASTCAVMLILAAPIMYIYSVFGSASKVATIGLLLICGFMVNGPYALITTAVSADLGTHKSLHGNAKALATVTAIIDGTGSIGAAIGPLLTGVLSPHGWYYVFDMLIIADLLALFFLVRLVLKEFQNTALAHRILRRSRTFNVP